MHHRYLLHTHLSCGKYTSHLYDLLFGDVTGDRGHLHTPNRVLSPKRQGNPGGFNLVTVGGHGSVRAVPVFGSNGSSGEGAFCSVGFRRRARFLFLLHSPGASHARSLTFIECSYLLGWRVCRTKFAQKMFFELRNFSRRMLRKFPRIFEPLYLVGPKKSCKAPAKSSAKFPRKIKIQEISPPSFWSENTFFSQYLCSVHVYRAVTAAKGACSRHFEWQRETRGTIQKGMSAMCTLRFYRFMSC